MSKKLYRGNFFKCFGIIYDRRQQGKVLHKLIDVLFIIVSACFCNINKASDIYLWCKEEQNYNWLKQYIALGNGIPSLATIRRVLDTIDPKQFEKCFVSWARDITIFSKEGGDTIAIDGKTMKGSKDGDKVTHIISAWCSANNLVLGQVKTDDKSNEITAIPELLNLLYIENCVVTIDAIGCQKKIVKKIRQKKADYVISLKANQETLYEEVKGYFEDKIKDGVLDKEAKDPKIETISMVEVLEKGHGRIERRRYYYSTDISWMIDAKKEWVDLKGIGMVYRQTTEKGKTTEEVRYHIGSIDNVKQYAKSAREHWGIEAVHWNLDISFRDDENRTRKGLAPENMAVAKRISLNMVRNEKEYYPEYSANAKRLIASMNLEYRTKIFDLNFKR